MKQNWKVYKKKSNLHKTKRLNKQYVSIVQLYFRVIDLKLGCQKVSPLFLSSPMTSIGFEFGVMSAWAWMVSSHLEHFNVECCYTYIENYKLRVKSDFHLYIVNLWNIRGLRILSYKSWGLKPGSQLSKNHVILIIIIKNTCFSIYLLY